MRNYMILLLPCMIIVLFVWNPLHDDTVISQFSVDAIAVKEIVVSSYWMLDMRI